MYNQKTEKSVLADYLICLSALVFMSIYYYGWRALIVTFISVGTCYSTDLVCNYLRKKKFEVTDFSSIATGMSFALLMPASVTYSVVVVSCIIMIIIGKQAFGGDENPVFGTVAVGYAFASLCWKTAFLLYPSAVPFGQLDLASNVSDKLIPSFTANLESASVPSISNFDILLGRFAGPMGTTHIVILLVCALILMFRKSISSLVFTSGLATILAVAFFFPPEIRDSSLMSLVFECMSGATLFVMLFVASDLKTSPKTKFGRLTYGIIIGLLSILFRRYAHLEVGIVFAVIIANVMSNPLDNNTKTFAKGLKALLIRMKTWPMKILRFLKFILLGIIKLIAKFFRLIKNAIIKNYRLGKEKRRLKKQMKLSPQSLVDENISEAEGENNPESKIEKSDEYTGAVLYIESGSKRMKRKFVTLETLKKEISEQNMPQKPKKKEKILKPKKPKAKRSILSLFVDSFFSKKNVKEEIPVDLDIFDEFNKKVEKEVVTEEQLKPKKRTYKKRTVKAENANDSSENSVELKDNSDELLFENDENEVTSKTSEINEEKANKSENEYLISSGGEHNW